MLRKAFMSAAVLVATAVPAASAQTNSFSTGTTFNSPGLTGISTEGQDMANMIVTWGNAAGTTGTDTWRNLGSLWGVSLGGFQVSHGASDDTFNSTWTVSNSTNSSVTWLQFNGAPGFTIFDCGWNGSGCNNTGTGGPNGTAGSADGRSLTTIAGGSYGGTVLGFYSNSVGIGASAPVGDLFEQLRIEFSSGLAAGQTYLFTADADNSDFNEPPPSSVVPEPASMTLLATGLAGMAAARRRKKQK